MFLDFAVLYIKRKVKEKIKNKVYFFCFVSTCHSQSDLRVVCSLNCKYKCTIFTNMPYLKPNQIIYL